jgi:uncharacterized protein
MANVALITGASGGLGAEFARLFAADGHDLVLVARRRDRLAALAAELGARHGVAAHTVIADLSGPEGVAQVLGEVDRLGLVVSHLVNNAGFGSSGPFADSDPARERAMVEVNDAAPLALTSALLPGMVQRRRGRILNIGSTAGFQPGPYMATYYASKAFLNSFSEALSYEVRGTGVSVTLSCPGTTATEFAAVAGSHKNRLERLAHAEPAAVAREAYQAMMAGQPLVVHGRANRVGVQLLRLAPRRAVRAVVAYVNRPRRV